MEKSRFQNNNDINNYQRQEQLNLMQPKTEQQQQQQQRSKVQQQQQQQQQKRLSSCQNQQSDNSFDSQEDNDSDSEENDSQYNENQDSEYDSKCQEDNDSDNNQSENNIEYDENCEQQKKEQNEIIQQVQQQEQKCLNQYKKKKLQDFKKLLEEHNAKLKKNQIHLSQFFQKLNIQQRHQKRIIQLKEVASIEQIIYTFYIQYLINHTKSKYFTSDIFENEQQKCGYQRKKSFFDINTKFKQGVYTSFRQIKDDFKEIVDIAKDIQKNYEEKFKFTRNLDVNKNAVKNFAVLSLKRLKVVNYILQLAGIDKNKEFYIDINSIPYAKSYEEWTDEQQQEYLFAIYSETGQKRKYVYLEISWLTEFEKSCFMHYIKTQKPQFYKPFTKGPFLETFKKMKFIKGEAKVALKNQQQQNQ